MADNTVAIVAITSGATLGAALIASATTQLALRRQLRSEAARQRATLRHERVLHDVDELRSLVDQGADALRVVREKVRERESSSWLDQSLAALEPLETRFVVRLGADNDVALAVRDAVAGLDALTDLYETVTLHTEGDEDRFWEEFERLATNVVEAIDAYYDAARRLVSARLQVASAESVEA